MRKLLLSSLFFMSISSAVLSQKVINDANAQSRNLKGFHAIDVAGGIDLYLTQGTAEGVAVSAAKTEHRDKIRTTVENGVLKIWFDYENRSLKIDWGNRKLKAYVSFINLDKLDASGGSDIKVEGTLKVNTLTLGISGGSDFDGKVDINNLSVNASGGSDADMSGKINTLKIDASGGSDFDGYRLVTETCDIEASGGSDVHITVNKELKANASGGSDIFYKGNAVIKDVKSSGSSIKKVSK